MRGRLDAPELEPFVRFAREAVAGEKGFLIRHSEILPGTFASTTETTDHLLQELGLSRTPVLQWGPLGMQQLSRVRRRGFEMRGFAGNAPDHVDHFHGMYRSSPPSTAAVAGSGKTASDPRCRR